MCTGDTCSTCGGDCRNRDWGADDYHGPEARHEGTGLGLSLVDGLVLCAGRPVVAVGDRLVDQEVLVGIETAWPMARWALPEDPRGPLRAVVGEQVVALAMPVVEGGVAEGALTGALDH